MMPRHLVTVTLSNVGADNTYAAQRLVLTALARMKVAKDQDWRVVATSADTQQEEYDDG